MEKLYLAAPLFSRAERRFNELLKAILEPRFDVYLPQEDGILLSEKAALGHDPRDASREIFAADIRAMDECEILFAVLDGRVIDEGVAFELGYCFANGKRCIGFQTDPRRLIAGQNNPMIQNACSQVFDSISALMTWVDDGN